MSTQFLKCNHVPYCLRLAPFLLFDQQQPETNYESTNPSLVVWKLNAKPLDLSLSVSSVKRWSKQERLRDAPFDKGGTERARY